MKENYNRRRKTIVFQVGEGVWAIQRHKSKNEIKYQLKG